jgi:hypothetical protein
MRTSRYRAIDLLLFVFTIYSTDCRVVYFIAMVPAMKKTLLLLILVGIAATMRGTAQSPNAFGIPSPGRPTPTPSIPAVSGSRAQGWLEQGRSEVIARHGIVATSDPLAAQAGLDILRRGGNAIDAAVATGAVLDVTSQNDTGIGGDPTGGSRVMQFALRYEF